VKYVLILGGRVVANLVVVDGPLLRRRRMSEGSASSTFPTSMRDRHCQGVDVAAVSRRCGGGPADRGRQPRYVNAALNSSYRQSSAEIRP